MLATMSACEVEPCVSVSNTTDLEKDLPVSIMRAITRAMTWRVGAFAELTKLDRSMLVEVLRCISKTQPQAPVFIRRETLAIRLECSLPTVTRQLNHLEDLGWISRHQVKSRSKGFQVGSLTLTKKSIESLGVLMTTSTAQRQSLVIDACSNSIKEQSLKRQLPQAVAFSKELPTQKTVKEIKLPESLTWLTKHMSPFGVCKLMKDAKTFGVRLEDVTTQCHEQISSAKNGFAYVRSLLNLNRDWTFMATQKAADSAERVAVEAQRADMLADLVLLQGKSFIGSDDYVRKVEGNMIVIYSKHEALKKIGVPMGSKPITTSFISAIETGLLLSWTATPSPVHANAKSITACFTAHGSSNFDIVINQ
jgi:DNA-binding MarR family transcriptional regulator